MFTNTGNYFRVSSWFLTQNLKSQDWSINNVLWLITVMKCNKSISRRSMFSSTRNTMLLFGLLVSTETSVDFHQIMPSYFPENGHRHYDLPNWETLPNICQRMQISLPRQSHGREVLCDQRGLWYGDVENRILWLSVDGLEIYVTLW
jgi:hypothetical protein